MKWPRNYKRVIYILAGISIICGIISLVAIPYRYWDVFWAALAVVVMLGTFLLGRNLKLMMELFGNKREELLYYCKILLSVMFVNLALHLVTVLL
jgi:uncharacterized membrane protein HdeD (DUF308 family)